jgi:hypothetical protein
MSGSEQLDRLNWRLSREGLGPLAVLSDEGTSYLVSALRSFAARLRYWAEERPLIALLLSVQIGFAIARLRHRRAHG